MEPRMSAPALLGDAPTDRGGVRAPSVNRRIFRAAVVIAALTLGVKLAALAKEVTVAASFGTADALDAFLIAFLLPSYLINVVGGSLNAALIPGYIQVRQAEGPAAAQRLFSGAVTFSGVLLLLATGVLAALGPFVLPLLASGFAPDKLLLTERLFYLLLPLVAVSGLATNWESVLNAGERFGLTAFAPVIVPLTTVATLFAVGAGWGVYALVLGTVGGTVLQLALLGWALRKQGLSLWPRWHGLDPALRRVVGQYLPMIAGSALISSTLLVDQSVAAMLDPGSVSVLSYGNKLIAPVLSIGTMALGTAVLPYFSSMVAAADWGGLRHTLKTYTWLILLATVPATAALVLLSGPLVEVLFRHGRFTEGDALAVSRVQAMYALQLPFYSLGILFVRLLSALRGNHILMWGTAISFILNIVLDLALLRVVGIAGIALSTSLVYVASCAFLGLMLRRRLHAVAGGGDACA
jgi:putative peptidoglycan lipid II flippase